MLRWRLFSAAIIVTLSLSLIAADFWLGNQFNMLGLALGPFAWLITLAGAGEVKQLIQAKGIKPRRGLCELPSVLVVVLATIPVLWPDYPANCPIGRLGWITYGILAALGISGIAEIVRFKQPNQIIERIAAQTFCAAYLGAMMGFLPALRGIGDNAWGLVALLSMIATVKLSDSAAYFTGRLLGRRKLTPLLSPGKTWEGAGGALLGGALAGWLIIELTQWLFLGSAGQIAPWRCAIYGLIVSLAGMIGDLFESLLKRDADIKDSSSWLPGLGGVLDVFDSILVAAPVAYVLWTSDLMTHG